MQHIFNNNNNNNKDIAVVYLKDFYLFITLKEKNPN